MKVMHWSQIYVNFISIEVTYDDDARQGWDYDCSQYATIQDVEKNMAADFDMVRDGWAVLMLHVSLNGEDYSVELDIPSFDTGEEFAAVIFEKVSEILQWQPAVIS